MKANLRRSERNVRLAAVLFLLFFLPPLPTFSADFTATTVGDYGNITVMEVTGNYDALNADLTTNDGPRFEIAREFFRTHKDEYDFLIIFSNFDFMMPTVEAEAYYLGVRNDTQGIGRPLFDNSSRFGSNGRLQGTVDIGNIAAIASNPLDNKFEETLYVLCHEIMHRWGAYVRFKNADGSLSGALLGGDASHWSYLLNSSGSVLYGNLWRDNDNGTFTSLAKRRYYSPLDLYLMGIYDKSQVPPMLLIENASADPGKQPNVGDTITGTPRYISIDSIIAAEGERTPGASDAQKTFTAAFIFITEPGMFNGRELYAIETMRNEWVKRYSILTDGKGIMRVAPLTREDAPVNPGPEMPQIVPRTLLPNIEDGVRWLMANQKEDGSWVDLSQTAGRDTAQAVHALVNFPIAGQNHAIGIQWLVGAIAENTDYLSRKIEAMKGSGQNIDSQLQDLLARRNPSGGWGSQSLYVSNPVDASFALKALSTVGYSAHNILSETIDYLKVKQNADGGWGGDDEGSNVEMTTNVLSAFNRFRGEYPSDDSISGGIAWLLQKQNPDGGFGNSPSTVYETAKAILVLQEMQGSTEAVTKGLSYILSVQSGDGSWYQSPYQTALAVDTVWKATIDPDLYVKTDDITFIPSTVTTLPADITIHAKIWNLGKTDVPQAKVVLYEGSVSDATKIGEQYVAFPGQSPVDLTFTATIRNGNEHRWYVVVDPDHLVRESSETNNTAFNVIQPMMSYDFEVSSADIAISPSPVDITKDTRISAKITNRGTMNAYNVLIRCYIDDAGGPIDIAQAVVDLPANATITKELVWRANRAGTNMPVTIWVDPVNAFSEIVETNNKASVSLTVNGSTDPNLTISYRDIIITPAVAKERGNVTITAAVKNDGFSTASGIRVDFYKGMPGENGALIGSRTIPSLGAGESQPVSIDWTNISESGERIITIKVDPDNLINEINEDDNQAFVALQILSLPDFAISPGSIMFTPSAPKEGDTVTIRVTVKNLGGQEALDPLVRIFEGDAVIGNQVIASIPGNSQGIAAITYVGATKGAHLIKVVIDPDNAVVERSKDNNTASASFGVQDANLWGTELYISPNGDGTKGSMKFFFRLSTPQTVKVIVVNERGETVRTFSGDVLNDTTGGSVTWNGLDESGMVVQDGQYQLKVVGGNDTVLGILLVTVDNNRSSLVKTIGSKYLLTNNLTCMLPDFGQWSWFPDESGLLLHIYDPNPGTPEYATGLYTVSPDGADIARIIPWEWSNTDPNYDYTIGYGNGYALSPDGEQVAFRILKRHKRIWNDGVSQLWVVDRDGKNLKLLDEYNLSQAWRIIGYDVKWSKDSGYITYTVSNPEELWIARPDGSEKMKIDSNYRSIDFKYLKWSPEGTRIAYAVEVDDAYQLRVADTTSNIQGIMDGYITSVEWLHGQKLVVLSEEEGDRKGLWLIDASGAGDPIKVTESNLEGSGDSGEKFLISPDGSSIAYVEKNVDRSSVMITDGSGHSETLHESLPAAGAVLVDLRWSPDGTMLAFVDRGYERINECYGKAHLVMVDSKTIAKKTFMVSNQDNLCGNWYGSISAMAQTTSYRTGSLQWFSDNLSFIATDSAGLFAISSLDGEKTYLPIENPEGLVLSPFGRYITYKQYVDYSNVCYGKGYQDLWALSSLLNLTADLRVTKENSAVILKGIAADLNFEGYRLEYADIGNPDAWSLIKPASNVPVINDVFTTWVPPYEGIFHVKLTVWDRAGNVKWDSKRVSWDLPVKITNIYKTPDIFAPSGSGVNDEVELHYKVVEPVHLEFNIYDPKGKVIRTYLKEHASPIEDAIAWDGRDSSGRIVPDGKYKLQVLGYEFYVEIDNTPPEVDISLGAITQLSASDGRPTGSMVVDLRGHAFDERIQYWVVEYGEGDNHQEWNEYAKGDDLLVIRDDAGNPRRDSDGRLSPASIVKIGDIEWLIGKKFRISAEDFAGNKASVVTGYLEEKIALKGWNSQPLEVVFSDEIETLPPLPANLIRPGIHSLDVLETVRTMLAGLHVQYWSNRQWIDGPTTENPQSGQVFLPWDNSAINPDEILVVRVRAIDELGRSYDSNMLPVKSLFHLMTDCEGKIIGHNNLFDTLRLLKIQIKSDSDPDYPQWADYASYRTEAGNSIPEGKIELSAPPIKEGMKYSIRMIGTGADANAVEYSTTELFYPQVCPGITLTIEYPEAACNALSGKASLRTDMDIDRGSATLMSLDYYLQKTEGSELLRHFDLSKERPETMTIDTSLITDGRYPIKATLKYLDLRNNAEVEVSDIKILTVDSSLPTAQITYPAASPPLCPVMMTSPKDDWYGIPVEAIASDDAGICQCKTGNCGIQLYYGVGENPVAWMAAKTRQGGTESPITGDKPVQGQLAVWDVTNLGKTDYTLQLKVVDASGNTSCHTRTIVFDNIVEIGRLSRDNYLFSPNGDGVLDDVKIDYEINEYATVAVMVAKLLTQPDGSNVLDEMPIRTIVESTTHTGGTGYVTWDGKSDSGLTVPDGVYGIVVFARDTCDNVNLKWIAVEVDNTPPTTVIIYPRPPDAIGNMVEVKVTSEDIHFLNYTLQAGQGDSPTQWITISSGVNPAKDDIIGQWNTFGLEGIWTIRLISTDATGNRNITSVTVTLDQRKTLIKDFGVDSLIFSPNHDGKLDAVTMQYELTDASQVTLEIRDADGVIRRTYAELLPSAGMYTYTWDGNDDGGAVVPDGKYEVALTTALSSNPSITQMEVITVTVDATPPTVDINQPQDNTYFKSDVAVIGTILDDNLEEYAITYTGDTSSPVVLAAGNQSRESYFFGSIVDPPEEKYTLVIRAKDAGENVAEKFVTLTIDRTPPVVVLYRPGIDEYFGSDKNTVDMAGRIVETNLDRYGLRYGLGDNPLQWVELLGGNTPPAGSELFLWKVGKYDGIPDGVYTVSLYAIDKAGQAAEESVQLIIDNTSPEVSITLPRDGDYIKAAGEIIGTAFDVNIAKYSLEIAEGPCSDAFRWAAIKTSPTFVQDGVLAAWPMIPPDGDYCIRLTTTDKLDNKAEAKVQVKVDRTPPLAPVLSGRIVNRTNVVLSWSINPEPDMVGYHIYRGAQRINTHLMQDDGYTDPNLSDGLYSYAVTAVDRAGNESGTSNRISLKVDTKAPEAKIRSPQDGGKTGGLIDIKGTAYSTDDFKEYRIYVGQGANPSEWNLIRTSSVPLPYDSLVQWDAATVEGLYSIRIEAEDISGNITTHQIAIMIDNVPPMAPVLLAATPNGSDVTVAWNANTEDDLAGYLLFRNDQIANANGIAVGNPKPYLMTGTSYSSGTIPDGKHKFYLVAVDQAGNLSDSSNALEVTIDTHAPHVTITEPPSSTILQGKTMIRAESPDSDIVIVQFQYKKVQDSGWISLGSAVVQVPYYSFIDPVSLGIGYGDYDIRAIAMDMGGNEDPSPSHITITYADMTVPDMPLELKALTNGTEVILTWRANIGTDLDGYNIYRTKDGTVTNVNTTLVKDATYQDTGLADGDYVYAVTAVDSFSNESALSGNAQAKIYAPVLASPDTPSRLQVITITGIHAGSNTSVEILTDMESGPVSMGTVPADNDGNFTIPSLNLAFGENKITARATDSVGNISRTSNTVFVVYNEPPSAPTGLAAVVFFPDVELTWNANTESDLAGYNLYQNGKKINFSPFLVSGYATASSYDGYNYSDLAFDNDPSTYWSSPYGYGRFNTVWWQLALSAPELINHVEILWGVENEGLANEKVYAGKEFEIQVWSGYSWITLAKVSGNTLKGNVFSLNPSYRTDRIRILITETTDPDASKQVWVAETIVKYDNLLTETNYGDFELNDDRYLYKLTAVDYYGMESAPSNEVEAIIGDVVAPSSPVMLMATPAASEIVLNWTANPEVDVTGYNLYRKRDQEWIKVNVLLITVNTYTEAGLANGAYAYRITAVDESNNESLPSGEAYATVFAALPSPPNNITILPLPDGCLLKLSWQYTGKPVAGYNIYRSVASGGFYKKINNAVISETSYTDKTVTNGIQYFYVIVAVDASGNESAWVNEISGIPLDTLPPAKPIIVYPALSGFPVTVYSDKTDVTGSADPGSMVELFSDGVSLGQATASENDLMQALSVSDNEYLYYLSLSPDGKILMYTKEDQTIWFRHLGTGKTACITENGDTASWSSNMRTIVYAYWDENGSYRLGIYDVKTDIRGPLTEDRYVYETSPSLSFDGRMIAFISTREGSEDVWIKDLADGSFVKLTNGGRVSSARISPDARMVAYSQGSTLNIIDMANLNVFQIDANSDVYSLAWSPDGKRLALVSYRNGSPDVFTYDTDTQTITQITNSPNIKLMPVWSPDSQSIAFVKRGYLGDSILVTAASEQGQEIPIVQRVIDMGTLSWIKAGALSYSAGKILNVIYFKGHFALNDVALQPGKNIFYTIASDAAGNMSEPSAGISITMDGGLMPDLEVTTDDIFIYPPYPKAGDPVVIYVTVRNKGQLDITDVKLDVYLDSVDRYKLLKSVTTERVIANSSETIEVDWNSTGRSGRHRVSAVVDPENYIDERSKTNNSATREMVVTEQYGLVMTTTLDSDHYPANHDIDIAVKLENSGEEQEVNLVIAVEDENGNPVEILAPITALISYTSGKVFQLSWNTGKTFSGRYRVSSIARSSSGVLIAQYNAPFEILPDLRISASIITDKAEYSSYQDVALGVSISNTGMNQMIPELVARIKIYDPLGMVLCTEENRFTAILPDAVNNLDVIWNTEASPPGIYSAVLEILIEGSQTVSPKTVVFTIGPLAVVNGTVMVAPQVVVYGGTYRVNYSVRNSGNVDISGLALSLLIIDPESLEVMATDEKTLDLVIGGIQSMGGVFSTQGYHLKTYVAVLQSNYQGIKKKIATTSLSVVDGIPPVMNILSPLSGKIFNSRIDLAVAAVDDISDISRVEYQVDSGEWISMPVSDTSSGMYSSSWLLNKAYEGVHIISFRASDKSGNTSQNVSVSVTIDVRPPDPPVIISPPDNSVVSMDVIDLSGTAEPGTKVSMIFSGLASAQADASIGAFSFIGVKLTPGVNVLQFTSTDKAGNTSIPTAYALNVAVSPSLALNIMVDKAAYHVDENVVITSAVRNTSAVSSLNNLAAKVSIINSQEQFIFHEDRAIEQLQPGQTAELVTTWNTAGNPKGQYSARVEVPGTNGMMNESTTGFTILGTSETGEGLKGTIAVSPNPVSQGIDETISYIVTNNGNEDVANLTITMIIINSVTQEVKTEYNRQRMLAKGEATMEGYAVPTTAFMPGAYRAILKVNASTMPVSKTLASASFEVNPGMEMTQMIEDVTNVLVWVEKRCLTPPTRRGSPVDDRRDHDGHCVRIDLLENILRNSVTDYRIVYNRDDFRRELRNPYFTDYFILGDYKALENHCGNELREQVFEGKGLISCAYLKYGEGHGSHENQVVGVSFRGTLDGDHHNIELVESRLSGQGELVAKGTAINVETAKDATVAGWIRHKGHKSCQSLCYEERSPAIVLHGYGEGKTVYFAFDLGETLSDENYDKMITIIRNSIRYVHRQADAESSYPGRFVPVAITLKSPSAGFDIRLKANYSPNLKLYDPLTSQWAPDNPWVTDIHMDPNQNKTVFSYVLTPDKAGTYTLQTEASYAQNGQYRFDQTFSTDITVGKDRKTVALDIIAALNSLGVSRQDRAKVKDAVKYIENVRIRPGASHKDMEKNMDDLLKAAGKLVEVKSCDIKSIRLMIDRLLQSWAGQLYFN